jgi:hypothetical protein
MHDFARTGPSPLHEAGRRQAAAVFSLDHVVTQHAAMLEAVGNQGS